MGGNGGGKWVILVLHPLIFKLKQVEKEIYQELQLYLVIFVCLSQNLRKMLFLPSVYIFTPVSNWYPFSISELFR